MWFIAQKTILNHNENSKAEIEKLKTNADENYLSSERKSYFISKKYPEALS